MNYSVYLCNTLVPGMLMILMLLTTVYTLGTELKENTAKELMQLADNSIVTALAGKLLPQTAVFFISTVFYNTYLYGFLHFPCNSGILPMLLAGFSFPVMGMHPTLQGLSVLFPLRHYFLIYVDLALNGYPLIYAWHSVVALLIFILLPFFVFKKIRTAMMHYVYIP